MSNSSDYVSPSERDKARRWAKWDDFKGRQERGETLNDAARSPAQRVAEKEKYGEYVSPSERDRAASYSSWEDYKNSGGAATRSYGRHEARRMNKKWEDYKSSGGAPTMSYAKDSNGNVLAIAAQPDDQPAAAPSDIGSALITGTSPNANSGVTPVQNVNPVMLNIMAQMADLGVDYAKKWLKNYVGGASMGTAAQEE